MYSTDSLTRCHWFKVINQSLKGLSKVYSMKYFFAKVHKVSHFVARYSSITLLWVVGIALSYATFYTVNHYENQHSLQQFQSSFKDKVTSLTQAISAIDKVFIASTSLLETSIDLSQEDFSRLITVDFLRNTGMQGVQWAPKVSNNQSKLFEAKVRDSGVFDYKIRKKSSGVNDCAYDNADNIFPVLFSLPSDVIGHELGFLLNSDCLISSGMNHAMQSRTITNVNFYNKQNEKGYRLLKAVFDHEENLRGYIVGIVMINQLIDTLWGDLNNSKNYQVAIFNQSNKNEKIYDSKWRNDCENNCQKLDEKIQLSANIPFENQIWTIEVTKFGVESRSRFYAYIVAILILFLTLGFSVYLFMNVNRVRWANSLVQQRTESLQHQASHDDLTQLLNKKTLSLELEKLSSNHNRHNGAGFALLFIDLDHFKKVNDTQGHLVGDRLLQQVAQRLRQTARLDDLIFRFGGDEFAVLLHNSYCNAKVSLVAERILNRLEQIYIIDNNKYRIGASIGVSVTNKISFTASEIIRNADIAMYEAKKQGRGQVVFYQADMYQCLVHKQSIEDELAEAIVNHHLSLYLQPIHDKNTLKGFEALSRWQHAEKGIIFPDEFISVAEETGLIHLLGQWLINATCLQLALWIQKFGKANCPYISINVSPIQLSQDEVVEQIIKALKQHNVPGELLAVELTESALIENKVIVKKNLSILQQLGVRVFLDDFGTGFSSLSLLQDFPIDVLKIDRSFIMGIEEDNEGSQKLVKAMINMAEALKMEVVAEGVENLNTLNWLHAANCKLMQGYYFSKPLGPQEINNYLLEEQSQPLGLLNIITPSYGMSVAAKVTI